jgi:hypothetical protein
MRGRHVRHARRRLLLRHPHVGGKSEHPHHTSSGFLFLAHARELMERKTPYEGTEGFPRSPLEAMRWIQRGGRPAMSPDVFPQWYQVQKKGGGMRVMGQAIMVMCWQKEPSGRPQFDE